MYLYNIPFSLVKPGLCEIQLFIYLSVFLYRNLSSVNENTRQKMRETHGLIDALVGYIQKCLLDTKVEEKVIV